MTGPYEWRLQAEFGEGMTDRPEEILSSHLPPATGKVEKFLELLDSVPSCTPSVAPDQAVLEQILAQR